MRTVWRIGVLLFMCCVATADAVDAGAIQELMADLNAKGQILLRFDTGADREMQIYSVTRNKVAQCPEWDARSDPPLSMAAAIHIAKADLETKHLDLTGFSLTSISLTAIAAAESPNRWYYYVSFSVKQQIKDGSRVESFRTVMLMDGTIVHPKNVPAETKQGDRKSTK